MFRFECGIKGCSHCFKCGSTYSSFKTHASRKHPNWYEYVNTDTVAAVPSAVAPGDSSSANTEELPLANPLQHAPCPDQAEYSELETISSYQSCSEAQRRAALFLLTFKEKYRLSQAAIDFAVTSLQTIVHSVCASAVAAVERDASSVAAIAANIEDPFASLRTNYQQTLFYRQEFGLVVSACMCVFCICLVVKFIYCMHAYRNLSLLNWVQPTGMCYLGRSVD